MIVKSQVLMLSEVSVAVHVTAIVSPAEKVEPEAGLQIFVRIPTSSIADAAKVATAPAALVATRSWLSGHVMLGRCLSMYEPAAAFTSQALVLQA